MHLPHVRTFMDTDTHALSEGDDIIDAVHRLIDEGVTGAPVVDPRGRLVGLLSEFDCLRLMTHGNGGDAPTGKVRDFMRRDVPTVDPDMDVYYVAGLFLSHPDTRRFAVIEADRVVGIITRKDILRAVGPRLQHG
ncbi:MAG: CBS domain-containing protein [Myxococcales bacterium]|nr:CBS domain-containing protein [Myxococcales bacterium]